MKMKIFCTSLVVALAICFALSVQSAASPPQQKSKARIIQQAEATPLIYNGQAWTATVLPAVGRLTLPSDTRPGVIVADWVDSQDGTYLVKATEQKRFATSEAINLDAGAAPLTGKRVMYVLTDAEGGLLLEQTGQGRKVPALISYNYRGRRDSSGHLVSPLTIFRPGLAGGLLLKDEVPSDSSRSPGTWDNLQPGDLFN